MGFGRPSRRGQPSRGSVHRCRQPARHSRRKEMKLSEAKTEIWVPDGMEERRALARTTHMAIAAHQDDVEIMALEGILEGFGSQEKWFTAVVVTNGAGSPRDGLYGKYTDDQMQTVRRLEQKKAAFVGEYAAVA